MPRKKIKRKKKKVTRKKKKYYPLPLMHDILQKWHKGKISYLKAQRELRKIFKKL